MKKLMLFLLLAVLPPVAFTGCSSPPDKRVAQVQTLKAVGHAAETAVATTAQLYLAGVITQAQADQVRNLYDNRFQPTFRVAVSAVNANLDSVASPELVALASQLAALVIQFQTHTP